MINTWYYLPIVLINQLFCLREKYDIKKHAFNIIDIKLQFVYTFLLNLQFDQFLNLYLHLYYENIGPLKAFNLWWSYFVLENLGE